MQAESEDERMSWSVNAKLSLGEQIKSQLPLTIGIIPAQGLKRIPGQVIPAVIIHRLGLGDTPEGQCLPGGQARSELRDDGADGIEEETFKRVVVKGAAGKGNVEAMVDRVDVTVEPLVDVEGAVKKILPAVHLCVDV